MLLGVVVALVVGLSPTASGAAPGRPPSPKEVAAAQKRANQAAARLATARSALAGAQHEVADLEARTASTRRVVDVLAGQVRQLAVQQYVRGNHAATWVGGGNPGQAARGRAMLRFVSLTRTDAVAGYQVARVDLEQSQGALDARLDEQRRVVERLHREEAKVTAELAALAAAQRAHEARVAAERAAAAKAAKAAAQRAPRASRSARPTLSLPEPLGVIGAGSWICPVQGPRAFSNDWGQARSGGRSHQGNDIMAPRGTPIVANVGGTVKAASSGAGGISYYLRGDDGDTYFGAHLERLSGVSGRVAAGTVIGYVGSSGNASASAPHLHFEIHPGGGRAVNPYPTLTKFC